MEYNATFAQKIDKLLDNQNRLEVALEALRGSIMPRHEIDAEIEKRVPISTYISDKTSIEGRLKDLEDAPSATWSRTGIILSASIGCLGLLVGSASIVVTIIIAIATHVL